MRASHTPTCALLVRHLACDCGGLCPTCGAELPCRNDHEPSRVVDLDAIRTRLFRGDASRDQVMDDARTLLGLLERTRPE